MQQEAINKITDSIRGCEETSVPAEPIAEFLKNMCSEDENFAALVIQEHKTLKKCFSFVYEQARKHLNGANGWIRDNDVYMMAVDYFSLDDTEIERRKAEEEKSRVNERKRKESEAKEQKPKEAKSKVLNKKVDEAQLSLF